MITFIYLLYLAAIIFFVSQLRVNNQLFYIKGTQYMSGPALAGILCLSMALLLSLGFPVSERNKRSVESYKVEINGKKFEGVYIDGHPFKLEKVDKFSKEAFIVDRYSFFGVRAEQSCKLEY